MYRCICPTTLSLALAGGRAHQEDEMEEVAHVIPEMFITCFGR